MWLTRRIKKYDTNKLYIGAIGLVTKIGQSYQWDIKSNNPYIIYFKKKNERNADTFVGVDVLSGCEFYFFHNPDYCRDSIFTESLGSYVINGAIPLISNSLESKKISIAELEEIYEELNAPKKDNEISDPILKDINSTFNRIKEYDLNEDEEKSLRGEILLLIEEYVNRRLKLIDNTFHTSGERSEYMYFSRKLLDIEEKYTNKRTMKKRVLASESSDLKRKISQ